MRQDKIFNVGDKVQTDYKGKIISGMVSARESWPNNENQYKMRVPGSPAGFIWRRPLDLRRVE